MDKIPFSVYDFFAYLSSGAVVLTAVDYVWGLGVLERKEVGPVLGVALVILAYVTGQILAQFSSFLFEHTIVERVLQRPLMLLLGAKPRWIVFAWLFPSFHRAFPETTQRRIKEQAASRSCTSANSPTSCFSAMRSYLGLNPPVKRGPPMSRSAVLSVNDTKSRRVAEQLCATKLQILRLFCPAISAVVRPELLRLLWVLRLLPVCITPTAGEGKEL